MTGKSDVANLAGLLCGLDRFHRSTIEECCVDPGRDVDTENFSIGLNLSYPSEKSQIVLGKRGLEESLLGLLRLGEVYFHGPRRLSQRLRHRPHLHLNEARLGRLRAGQEHHTGYILGIKHI
jgi:hypothetical protein